MAQNKKKKSPAVEAAKERLSRDAPVILSTGVKARIVPVASSLISDISSRIKDPKIPTWYNKDKEREEENPNDPEYLVELAEAADKRNKASLDAIILFGINLIDEVPDEGEWLAKLKYAEKLGHIDIGDYDLSDPIEKEFLYKRYIAVASDDILEVCRRSGITEADIAQAMASFPGS